MTPAMIPLRPGVFITSAGLRAVFMQRLMQHGYPTLRTLAEADLLAELLVTQWTGRGIVTINERTRSLLTQAAHVFGLDDEAQATMADLAARTFPMLHRVELERSRHAPTRAMPLSHLIMELVAAAQIAHAFGVQPKAQTLAVACDACRPGLGLGLHAILESIAAHAATGEPIGLPHLNAWLAQASRALEPCRV